jgi:hypothetical protein
MPRRSRFQWCGCCDASSSSTDAIAIDRQVSSSESAFYSAVSFHDTTVDPTAGYFPRPCIPSTIDFNQHPDKLWWSDAQHDRNEITADLGHSPKLLSNLIHVKTSRKSQYDPKDLMDYFSEFRQSATGRCFVVYQMRLNEVLLTSLFEVTDRAAFNEWMGDFPSATDILGRKLKLITCPTNLPINLPLKGPKSADTLLNYFGKDAVRFSWHQNSEISYACVSVDIFSVWIIRRILPTVALSKGRVCDFILLDYRSKCVVCGLRVLCTNEALRVLNAK